VTVPYKVTVTFWFYEVGGISSVVTAGFFRKVKNPTPIGISIRMSERQSITNPAVGGSVPELLTPLNSVENGMLPVAVTAPKIQINNPGQPHRTTAAMVAMMPVFLFCIVFSYEPECIVLITMQVGCNRWDRCQIPPFCRTETKRCPQESGQRAI